MKQCPKCGSNNRDTAKFCSNCSGPLLMPASLGSGKMCPQCGTDNQATARFCRQCGYNLAAAPWSMPSQPPVHHASQPSPPPQVYPTPPFTPSPGGSATGRLPANMLLNQRYIIQHKLGQGGMGAVYKAVDTRLSQVVAVKEMSSASLPTMAERQQAVAAFKQEATMLATLHHRNLPRVSDHFDESGRHYMVMEFIEGKTLLERLEQQGRMPEAEVERTAGQLCEVLHYLHSQKPPIIFRDLKPGNIMIQPDGEIKLIDFGIVRLFDPAKKKDTQLLGTPGFAAPEAYSHQTDARSDIFSLGMTMYAMLTANEPPESVIGFQPATQLASISPRLSGVIQKAVEVKRDDRWVSAAEMRQAISTGQVPPNQRPSTGTKAISQPSGPVTPPASSSSGKSAPLPVSTSTSSGGGGIRRATQRLTMALSRQMKQMSTQQLFGLAAALVIGLGIITWLVGPWLAENMPWLWYSLPLYYAAGPFAYAVSNRKGAAILVHTPLHLIITGLTWYYFDFFPQLIGGLLAGGVMELILGWAGAAGNRLWYYVGAAASAVTLLMMITLAFTPEAMIFDIKDVIGAGLAGALAYGAGEVVWGVRTAGEN